MESLGPFKSKPYEQIFTTSWDLQDANIQVNSLEREKRELNECVLSLQTEKKLNLQSRASHEKQILSLQVKLSFIIVILSFILEILSLTTVRL